MNVLYYVKQIESLRSKLLKLVSVQGNFTDDKVVQLSQLLDEYLVEYQKMMDRGEAAPYVVNFTSASRLKVSRHRTKGMANRSNRG